MILYIFILVKQRRMPMHQHTIDDPYGLFPKGNDNELNMMILERVITGQAKSDQLIGLSKKALAKIDRVIEDERNRRNILVAYYLERYKTVAIDSHILQMCTAWESLQPNRDKEKTEKAMKAKETENAQKAEKAMKAKQDRIRDRHIAAEAKAIKKMQAWCAKENSLLVKRLCRVESSDWAAQLFALPEPGDDSDDDCPYEMVSSSDEEEF